MCWVGAAFFRQPNVQFWSWSPANAPAGRSRVRAPHAMWVMGVRAARGGTAGAAHAPAAGEGSAREGRRVGRRLTARLAFSGLRRVDMGLFCAKIGEYGPQGLLALWTTRPRQGAWVHDARSAPRRRSDKAVSVALGTGAAARGARAAACSSSRWPRDRTRPARFLRKAAWGQE